MKRIDTHNQILSEVETLTCTWFLSSFRYVDLPEQIGIQKISEHHHFTNKEGRSSTVIERCLCRMQEIMAHSFSILVRLSSGLRPVARTNGLLTSSQGAMCMHDY
jgi:hypothetical protein